MKYHLLFVEDEQPLFDMAIQALTVVSSFHVTGCETSEGALKVMQSDPPDVAILSVDLSMGKGVELLHEVKKINHRMPVVAVSSQLTSYAHVLSKYNDIVTLKKPYTPRELLLTVEDYISRHSFPTPIGPFQLVDYIQISGYGRYSLVLQVNIKGSHTGIVEIVSGDIWNAFLGELTGYDALCAMMDGGIESLGYTPLPATPTERHIKHSWEEALMELARLQDESGRDGESEWDDLIATLHSRDDLQAIGDDFASFASYEALPSVSPTTEAPPHLYRELLQSLANGQRDEMMVVLKRLNSFSNDQRMAQSWIRLLEV